MKFQLDFQMPESSSKLKHGNSAILLGSCFSDNLAPKFENAGFRVCSNPLGTIFHPSAISEGVRSALIDFKPKAVNRDDLWFDWRASGMIYGTSENALNQTMQSKLELLRSELSSARMLVVTLGTAWGYQLNSGEIVANCHKLPQSNFEKKLSDLNELVEDWTETIKLLKELNPKLQLVFTVSPVRHSKDGLIENNRSKARLIQLCESLSGDYFPSYELVIDVLRDYRFFETDLVHPNTQAVDFVWEHGQSFFFSEETQDIIKEVEAVNRMRMHKSLQPESKAAEEFAKTTQERMKQIEEEYPDVWWHS